MCVGGETGFTAAPKLPLRFVSNAMRCMLIRSKYRYVCLFVCLFVCISIKTLTMMDEVLRQTSRHNNQSMLPLTHLSGDEKHLL